MFFHEDSSQAADYLRAAVPLMVKNNIAPNPCNFALWYSYVSDRTPELNAELDQAIEQYGTCPPALSIDLFVKYIIDPNAVGAEETQDSIRSVIENLFSGLDQAVEGSKSYEQTLQKSLENLQTSSEKAVIEDTIQNLIHDTEVAAEVSHTFQAQLNSAKDEIETLKNQLEQSKRDALKDELTQVGNRRYFDAQLSAALTERKGATSLMIIDLDHFKRCNDTYGHVMGDKILQGMGMILKDAAPEHAAVARYGGEEFAIIVKDCALEDTAKYAEEIRNKVTQLRIKQKNNGSVIDSISVSIGVAEYDAGESPDQFIKRADEALYLAKESGRNQVQMAA